jgi:thiol-disulfide isomerase/thioredoxin
VDGVPSGVPREGHSGTYFTHANMSSKGFMNQVFLALVLCASAVSQTSVPADSPTPAIAEAKIVRYLRENVRPGAPVVVSTLTNEIFPGEVDRRVLNRLFNTFFKMPLYVVQAQMAAGVPPSLKELSEQFAFTSPETADVLLRIMDMDPRVPKFLERDPRSGEILKVDSARILGHPRFGKILERTIAGWEGKPAPEFSVKAYDGSALALADLRGKPFLLYFWFSNCPPCVKTAPLLVELDKEYAPKGFRIVGLNADRLLELDDSDADRAAYATKLGISFTQAHANAEIQAAYGGVAVFPTLFFVDRAGTIVEFLVNAPDRNTLEEAVKLALK